MSIPYKNHANTIHYYTECSDPAMYDVNWTIEDVVITVSRTGHPSHRKSDFNFTVTSKKGIKADAKCAKDIMENLQATAVPKTYVWSTRIAFYEYSRTPRVSFPEAIKLMVEEYYPDVLVMVNVSRDLRPMLTVFETLGFAGQVPVEDLDGRRTAWIFSNPLNVTVMVGRPTLLTFQFSIRKDNFPIWIMTVLEDNNALPQLVAPSLLAPTPETITIDMGGGPSNVEMEAGDNTA